MGILSTPENINDLVKKLEGNCDKNDIKICLKRLIQICEQVTKQARNLILALPSAKTKQDLIKISSNVFEIIGDAVGGKKSPTGNLKLI